MLGHAGSMAMVSSYSVRVSGFVSTSLPSAMILKLSSARCAEGPLWVGESLHRYIVSYEGTLCQGQEGESHESVQTTEEDATSVYRYAKSRQSGDAVSGYGCGCGKCEKVHNEQTVRDTVSEARDVGEREEICCELGASSTYLLLLFGHAH